MDCEQPSTSTAEPASTSSAWASPSCMDETSREEDVANMISAPSNSPPMGIELPARTLHIRVDLGESSPSTEMIGLGSACATPKHVERMEQEFHGVDDALQCELACDEFLQESHTGSREENARMDTSRLCNLDDSRVSEAVLPVACGMTLPAQDESPEEQSVPQQLALFVEERVQRLSASLQGALEQQAANVNCEIERAKEQWACSLAGERSQRYEGLNALHFELKQYQTVFSELQPVLRSQLEHHDRAITELSPRVRKCIDDGLLALHKSVELHDCTIAEMSPRLKKRIDEGLTSLRNEVEHLKAIVQKISSQPQSSGELRPESVDKIFEMIGSETRTQVKTLQVTVEKRIAHIMTLELGLEKKVAERYNVLERNLTEMNKRVEQTECLCKRVEDELRQELLLARREFNEHRVISERVEALAATALTATQRELQKHQEVLSSLGESVRDLDIKYREVPSSPFDSSFVVSQDFASFREELSSRIQSETQRLQQSQQGQQNLLDDLLTRAQRLQEQMAGLFSQCLSKWNQEEFCRALEKSQEQLASLQQMLEKSLDLVHHPEYSPTPQAHPETPQVCSLEASLADIRGRLFAQQCAQDDLQREISSLRGGSVPQLNEHSSAAAPSVGNRFAVQVSQAIRVGSRVEVRCQDAWYKGTVLKLPQDDVENQGRYSVQCDADGGGQTIRSKSVRLVDQENTALPSEILGNQSENNKVVRMSSQVSRLERRFPERYATVVGSQRKPESQ